MKFLFSLCCGLGVTSLTAAAPITLKNTDWKVRIEPKSFAIYVQPTGKKEIQVTEALPSQSVSKVDTKLGYATWQRGNFHYITHLDGPDLYFLIQASLPSSLEILRQPFLGKGLILPLGEGHYIPAGNALWKEFLIRLEGFDTAEGFSLPFWGNDLGNYSLHWILTSPFNNLIQFTKKSEEISFSHDFTKLTYREPFTFFLHLGKADLLAGSKRYRKWLIAQGKYQTLKKKIAQIPEGEKLIGATHIYLVDNGLLAPANARDWKGFLEQLRTGAGVTFSKLFDQQARDILQRCGSKPDRYQQQIIIDALNNELTRRARNQWQNEDSTAEQLVESYHTIRNGVLKDFGSVLDSDLSIWGDTLTAPFFKQLATAGLTRLWIGLENGWEGGLWHPEAVAAAVRCGFLIAPYDSYETALLSGDNSDWVTGHLGKKGAQTYGIIKENGLLQPGFRKAGAYTNPRSIRPLLQARIQAIKKQAGFNSWFLDAYGAALLFEDYRSGKEMTMEQSASEKGRSLQWIGETLKIPVGSEGGNAVTSTGIFFAHGMQTQIFEWLDPDMKNKNSDYFLGSWWPPAEPAVFFKPVPIKEPYRTVYFDPTMRLPLYQAVFHGSIITTHHWSFDNLKLTNVRQDNELTQLLYNVPPLYHLSANTLAKRLPVIVRQDTFFRPLHLQLAFQELTDFRWLTKDRLVQQTTFSDGTRLVANFGEKSYSLNDQTIIPPHAILALRFSTSPLLYQTDMGLFTEVVPKK